MMNQDIFKLPVVDAEGNVCAFEVDFSLGLPAYLDSVNSGGDDGLLLETIGNEVGLIYLKEQTLSRNFDSLDAIDRFIFAVPAIVSEKKAAITACEEFKDKCAGVAVYGLGLKTRNTPFLDYADFAIVDFSMSTNTARRVIASELVNRDIRLIATNVRDEKDFISAKSLGYTWFHGAYFPGGDRSGKLSADIGVSKLLYLQLMREVFRPKLRYDEMTEILQKDVSLTFKLLKYINSPWYGIRHKVKSIKHALVMLGPKEIRRWMAVVAVGEVAGTKSRDLLRQSLIRGRVAERISMVVKKLKQLDGELFLMGLFSLIDQLANITMNQAMNELSLSESISNAILHRKGPLGPVYTMIVAYEENDDEKLEQASNDLGIESRVLAGLMRMASDWADRTLEVQ